MMADRILVGQRECANTLSALTLRSGVTERMAEEYPITKPFRTIPLTCGLHAIVDEEDYEYLSQFSWHAMGKRGGEYVGRSTYINRKHGTVFMHHDILDRMGLPRGRQTDHRNRNRLDNRRENVRPATNRQNCANSKLSKRNNSGYKGVCWNKLLNKWVAQISLNRVGHRLGSFDDPRQAALVYAEVSKRALGEEFLPAHVLSVTLDGQCELPEHLVEFKAGAIFPDRCTPERRRKICAKASTARWARDRAKNGPPVVRAEHFEVGEPVGVAGVQEGLFA